MYQEEQNSLGEPVSRAKRPADLDHWRSAAALYRERRMSPRAHPPTHSREVGECAGKDDNARRYLWTTTVVPRRKIASPSWG